MTREELKHFERTLHKHNMQVLYLIIGTLAAYFAALWAEVYFLLHFK